MVPEIGSLTDPSNAMALPFSVADVALVVVQVTKAVVGESSDALIAAVGAPVLVLPATVALWVAVWPVALRATIVNVVVPDTGMLVDPLAATALPLIVTDVALFVDQVTRAEVDDSNVALIVAVGAGVGVLPATTTVALAVAVWPAALRATIV